MKVDLSKLFDNPGETQEFSAALDLGDVRRWGSGLFHQPVRIAGIARNRAGIVDVGYTVDFVLETVSYAAHQARASGILAHGGFIPEP